MGEAIAEVGYLAGECQFDGLVWRKSNLLFGYNAIWDENLGGTATGTSYTKATLPVPAGELLVLQAISCVNQTRGSSFGRCAIARVSGAFVILADMRPLAQFEPVFAVGVFVLGEGDYAYVSLGATQVDDVILAGVVGYRMRLDL